jgi:hypothetical protein
MPVTRPVYKPESGSNTIEERYIKRFDRLRSTFPDSNDYLLQAETDSNSTDPKRTYFRGGVRSLQNVCTFTAVGLPGIANFPQTITLYLSPNNVTWDYQLRTNVIDTYGGQVVQILGVSIENLTIQGFFGSEGMWGYNIDQRTRQIENSRYENFPNGLDVDEISYNVSDTQAYKQWVDGPMRSGMIQFSEWFKTYFYYITQAGNFNKNNIIFRYPHLNWNWKIRPLDFPRVRFSNDELMPQWELKCDFIEDLQSNFEGEVTAAAKKALGRFRDTVGFSEFIEWSEPVYTNTESRKSAARDIATKYSDFIGGDFSEKEIETLLTRGFSYEVNNLTPHTQPRGSTSTNANSDQNQEVPDAEAG